MLLWAQSPLSPVLPHSYADLELAMRPCRGASEGQHLCLQQYENHQLLKHKIHNVVKSNEFAFVVNVLYLEKNDITKKKHSCRNLCFYHKDIVTYHLGQRRAGVQIWLPWSLFKFTLCSLGFIISGEFCSLYCISEFANTVLGVCEVAHGVTKDKVIDFQNRVS